MLVCPVLSVCRIMVCVGRVGVLAGFCSVRCCVGVGLWGEGKPVREWVWCVVLGVGGWGGRGGGGVKSSCMSQCSSERGMKRACKGDVDDRTIRQCLMEGGGEGGA